jgi:Tol biopolymer transport system component
MKHSWSIAFGLAVATLCAPLVAGQGQSAPVMLEAARKVETIDGNPKAAIAQYEAIVKGFANDRAVVADALVRMAGAYRKLGDKQAMVIYERVVNEYGDQTAAAAAARAALRVADASERRQASLSKRRLWSGPQVDTTGRVTPDGRYLTFTDWETGDLAVRDLKEGTSRRLTNKGSLTSSSEFADQSVVSPDGQFVAYGWAESKVLCTIQVVDLQGKTAPRRLFGARGGGWVTPLDWSGDGQRLAVLVQRAGARDQVIVLDATTGSVVATIEVQDRPSVRFSPEGRLLALDRVRATPNGMARDIVVVDLTSRREHRIIEGTGHNAPMAWTREGLLYTNTSGAGTALWLQRMQDGKAEASPVLVTNDAGGQSLGVTAEGALVFGAGAKASDLNLVEVDFETGTLVGEPARPLDGVPNATWSRDGAALVYVLPRSPSGRNPVLGVRDSATGRVRELQPDLLRFALPKWTPDGKAVVVHGMTIDTKQGLFSIDVASGAVTPLVLAGEGEQLIGPQPSPDGKHLYFVRSGPSSQKFVARDLSSGAEREIAVPAGAVRVQLSPDGTQFALLILDGARNRMSVVVLPASGGEAREVFAQTPAASLFQLVTWSKDGRYLLTIKDTDGSPPANEMIVLPLDDAKPRTIRLPMRVGGGPAVHPDGRHVAFPALGAPNEVWVLENFLPGPKSARQ